jgi:hypothetical protein
VEHPLDVVVLLEPIDQREDLGGLVFRELHGRLRHVLGLRGSRGDPLRLEGLLEPAEVVEAAAQDDLGLALLAAALASSSRPASISSSSNSSSGGRPSGCRRNTPIRLNMKPTLPLLPRLPPPLVKCERTFATVRVGLSVAVSTRIGTPWGP